jgi:hypothetical protein
LVGGVSDPLPPAPLPSKLCCNGSGALYQLRPFNHKSARACGCQPCQALALRYAAVHQGGRRVASDAWKQMLGACTQLQQDAEQ